MTLYDQEDWGECGCFAMIFILFQDFTHPCMHSFIYFNKYVLTSCSVPGIVGRYRREQYKILAVMEQEEVGVGVSPHDQRITSE